MQEAGVEDCIIKGTWVGWFVPAGTPQKAIAMLAEEVSKAVQNRSVMLLRCEGFGDGGSLPRGHSLPEQLLMLHDTGEEPSRRRQHHAAIFEADIAHLVAADAACIGRSVDPRR